jgi:hypothetical protein
MCTWVVQPSDAENCLLTSANASDIVTGTGGGNTNSATNSDISLTGVHANAVLIDAWS